MRYISNNLNHLLKLRTKIFNDHQSFQEKEHLLGWMIEKKDKLFGWTKLGLDKLVSRAEISG
jgi:hypothetical protein